MCTVIAQGVHGRSSAERLLVQYRRLVPEATSRIPPFHSSLEDPSAMYLIITQAKRGLEAYVEPKIQASVHGSTLIPSPGWSFLWSRSRLFNAALVRLQLSFFSSICFSFISSCLVVLAQLLHSLFRSSVAAWKPHLVAEPPSRLPLIPPPFPHLW